MHKKLGKCGVIMWEILATNYIQQLVMLLSLFASFNPYLVYLPFFILGFLTNGYLWNSWNSWFGFSTFWIDGLWNFIFVHFDRNNKGVLLLYLGFPVYTLRTMCMLSVWGGELRLYMLVVIDLCLKWFGLDIGNISCALICSN